MNLKYFCLAVFTAVLPMFTACSDFERDKVDVIDMVSSDNVIFFEATPSADQDQTIQVETDASWKIAITQSEDSWLTVTPMEGMGNATLTFHADKNKGAARSAIVTISAERAEQLNITVKQKAQKKGDKYNFDSFKGVYFSGLNDASNAITLVDDEGCEDGKGIRIYTRPGEEHMGTNGDRFKVNTDKMYYSGRYEWRVFIPKLGMNDRTSVAGFIYNDDRHELDFEISSGTAENRAKYGAADDELLCLISSQANPVVSETVVIKADAWHNIAIDMKLNEEGKYIAEWLVNDIPVISKTMNYGEEIAFRAISSVENLMGMGDHAATQENYAIFDWFEYIPYDYSKKPIGGDAEEPEPDGKVVKWEFDDNKAPAEWMVPGTATFADGWMVLPMPGCNTKINDNMGAGKVTFEIDVPQICVGEKYVSGPNIGVNNISGVERSFSMFIWAGSQADRDAVGALPGQMLVRCYTEALGVFNVPIDPGKHTFALDLRLNEEDQYYCTWIIDGEKVKTFQTWYTSVENKFDLQFSTMANGGGWQGQVECTDTYETKYNYIEYKRYSNDGSEEENILIFEFDEVPTGWNLGDASIGEGSLNISNAQVVRTDITARAAKYSFELDVPLVPAGEKWFNGLNIFATNADERSFSLYLCPGAQEWREAVGAIPGQMLVRCYTEVMDPFFLAIDPGVHTFELDLQLNEDGYLPIWYMDGEEMVRKQTTYTPEDFTFGLEFRSFADGGNWQGDSNCTDTYTGKYNWFKYKPY